MKRPDDGSLDRWTRTSSASRSSLQGTRLRDGERQRSGLPLFRGRTPALLRPRSPGRSQASVLVFNHCCNKLLHFTGLKQHKFIIPQFWRSEAPNRSYCAKMQVQRGSYSFWSLWGRVQSLPLPAPEDTCSPRHVAPSSISRAGSIFQSLSDSDPLPSLL